MYKKIHIIGISGTGKTTLGSKIKSQTSLQHFDLDDYYWTQKYTQKASPHDFKTVIDIITKKNKWVIEGSYVEGIESSLEKSELILWLDILPHANIYQIIKRYFACLKECGNPNQLFKLIKYVIENKKKERGYFHKYKKLLNQYKKKVIRLKTQKDIDKILDKILPP